VSNSVIQMSTGQFWGSFTVLVLLALLAFYGLFRFFSRARLIEDTPTSRLRSAAQGYIEVMGVADLLPGTPIIAPLSLLQCIWYSYKIEEKRTRSHKGRQESYWAKVESGTSDGLFRLRDTDGECIVDPDGAEVTPSISQTWYGMSRHPGGAPTVGVGGSGMGNMLARVGISNISVKFGFGDRYRYSEQRIPPATDIYVIGQYRTLGGGGDPGDRHQEIGLLLRDWKKNQAEMLARFDTNGDGEIDLVEWDTARRTAETEVDAALRERQAAAPVNVVAKTGIGRRPFIISTRSQHEMARSYRWSAAGCLVAFLGCGGGAVWMLGVRLAGAG